MAHNLASREDFVVMDLRSLPIAGHLNDEHAAELETLGFDCELLFQLPFDGPFTPEQVMELARGRALEGVVSVIRTLPVDGPLSPEQVLEVARLGPERVATAVPEHDGPVGMNTILRLARDGRSRRPL